MILVASAHYATRRATLVYKIVMTVFSHHSIGAFTGWQNQLSAAIATSRHVFITHRAAVSATYRIQCCHLIHCAYTGMWRDSLQRIPLIGLGSVRIRGAGPGRKAKSIVRGCVRWSPEENGRGKV